MKADPGAMGLIGFEAGEPIERMAWKRVRRHAPDAVWPPKGAYLRMDYGMAERSESNTVVVSVRYELYDGIPAMSSVEERRDGFLLAVVEPPGDGQVQRRLV